MAGLIVTVTALLQSTNVPADYRSGMLTTICYAVPYAITGAFLIARRPDLPFGWILSGAAMLAAVGSGLAASAYLAVSRGASQQLAILGYAGSALNVLPAAVQGLVNVRFPSGRLSSRFGRVLEVSLITGIVLALAGGMFGDYRLSLVRADGAAEQVSNPLTAGTAFGKIAEDVTAVVPVVVLLGLIAGLSVVRRAWKARGIERYQLRWRAYGVVLSLLLFPLAITGTLPTLADALDGLFFVTTLIIPIVRYRLWAIDTVIRRSAAYALVTIAVAGLFAAIAAAGTAAAGAAGRVHCRRGRGGCDVRPGAKLQSAARGSLLLRAAQRPVPGAQRSRPAAGRGGGAGRGAARGGRGGGGVTAVALRRDRAAGRRVGAGRLR